MCKHGTTVPMPLNGRVRAIDSCLALLVATLNTMPELATVACCCGHGRMPPSVILADDRWLVILTREEADRLYAQYPTDIHGQPRLAPSAVFREFDAEASLYLDRIARERDIGGTPSSAEKRTTQDDIDADRCFDQPASDLWEYVQEANLPPSSTGEDPRI